MKAIVYTKYGLPEVLQLQEVEKPAVEQSGVLVKIHAASLNFGDAVLVSGRPFISRLMGYGLFKPKYRIIGTDIAGTIEAVGSNANKFQPGNEVFGDIEPSGFGAFAEYVAVPERELILKPANVTFEQAAAVPQAGVVALQGLRDNGQIQSGQKVLINGASGGVGTFAVQIAKSFGAEVTGVCSTRGLDLLRSIGADHVIDYTQEDFTKNECRYDLIFDIVANRSISDYLRALTPTGNYVAVAFNPTSLILGSLVSMAGKKKVSSLIHKPNVKDLEFMQELLGSGKVVPVIDRSYPLSEVAEAIRYLGEGHHQGKIVIKVNQNTRGGN